MPSTFQIERNLGSKEARQQLAMLREKWPIAFPADAKDVRPLAISAAGEIAAAMNWSLSYTLGVLARWKMAAIEAGVVPMTGQDAVLDAAALEWETHVRAAIVDCEERPRS
jgi:hypothetical protein